MRNKVDNSIHNQDGWSLGLNINDKQVNRNMIINTAFIKINEILSKDKDWGDKQLDIENILFSAGGELTNILTNQFRINLSKRDWEFIDSKRDDIYKFIENLSTIVAEDEIEGPLVIDEIKVKNTTKNKNNTNINAKSNKSKKSKVNTVKKLSKIQNNRNDFYTPIIIKVVGIKYLVNILISYFIHILSIQGTEEECGMSTIDFYTNIGNRVVNYYYRCLYNSSKSDNLSFSMWKNTNKDKIVLDDVDVAGIGGYLCESLVDCKLIEEKLVRSGVKLHIQMKPTIEVTNLLTNDNTYKIYSLPYKLPMVCEPKKFIRKSDGQVELGGFLLNDVEFTQELFIDKRFYMKKSKVGAFNCIYDMINGFSRTRFKINVDTLNYLYEFGFTKNLLLSRDTSDYKELVQNSLDKRKKHIHRELQRINSKLYLQENILNIAETFKNVPNIYFPVKLDHRGRIYCDVDYLNYQSSDLAKSLILYSEPGIITRSDDFAISYLKSYGGTLFGLKKLSKFNKAKWVDDNEDYILNFLENDIIDKSESPLCFISWCFEYKRFKEFMNNSEASVFKTYLPIQLDASCNGYQHLALLTKETKVFNKLNLASASDKDPTKDWYNYIVNKINSYITNDLLVKDPKNESFKRLSVVNFDRSAIKSAIMTYSYNASLATMVKNIINNLERDEKGDWFKVPNTPHKVTYKDLFSYVKCFKHVVGLEFPKMGLLSKYLKSVIKIYSVLNVSIPWTLPSGLEISQGYQAYQSHSLKAFDFSKSRHSYTIGVKDKIDVYKQYRALMPNLIHSLDASTIALVYNQLRLKIPEFNLYTVHDCFGVTADNVVWLISELKDVYLMLYSQPGYLFAFDRHSLETIQRLTSIDITPGVKFSITANNRTYNLVYPDVSEIVKTDPIENKYISHASNLIS